MRKTKSHCLYQVTAFYWSPVGCEVPGKSYRRTFKTYKGAEKAITRMKSQLRPSWELDAYINFLGYTN